MNPIGSKPQLIRFGAQPRAHSLGCFSAQTTLAALTRTLGQGHTIEAVAPRLLRLIRAEAHAIPAYRPISVAHPTSSVERLGPQARFMSPRSELPSREERRARRSRCGGPTLAT